MSVISIFQPALFMLCLKSFIRASLFDEFEIEIKEEIFSKYKYALAYIGVDFMREDVQEALLNCIEGFIAISGFGFALGCLTHVLL